jgi:hypothetical protein
MDILRTMFADFPALQMLPWIHWAVGAWFTVGILWIVAVLRD